MQKWWRGLVHAMCVVRVLQLGVWVILCSCRVVLQLGVWVILCSCRVVLQLGVRVILCSCRLGLQAWWEITVVVMFLYYLVFLKIGALWKWDCWSQRFFLRLKRKEHTTMMIKINKWIWMSVILMNVERAYLLRPFPTSSPVVKGKALNSTLTQITEFTSA